jgi:hypothetical protein
MNLTYDQAYDMAIRHHYSHMPLLLIRLCDTLPLPVNNLGRPPTYSVRVMLVLLVMFTCSHMTYRQFCAALDRDHDLLSVLDIPHAPHYSTLNRATGRLDRELLARLVTLMSELRPPPRHLAIDSTGLSHSTGGEWRSVRLVERRVRRFHGLCATLDTESMMFVTTQVNDRPRGDAPQLEPLVEPVDTSALQAVIGDSAFLSRANIAYIAGRGVRPVLKPKGGHVGHAHGCRAYAELVRSYRDDPEKWARQNDYGLRSLIESGYSALKRRYGGGLRSRGDGRRSTEVLLKVVAYNGQRLLQLLWEGR